MWVAPDATIGAFSAEGANIPGSSPRGETIEGIAKVGDIDTAHGTSLAQPARSPDDATKKGRRAREFDVRKERAADRKAKSERLKRKQELDRLKKAKIQAAEVLEQQQECVAMQQEDDRSRDVDRYMR